mgnify:FL=1
MNLKDLINRHIPYSSVVVITHFASFYCLGSIPVVPPNPTPPNRLQTIRFFTVFYMLYVWSLSLLTFYPSVIRSNPLLMTRVHLYVLSLSLSHSVHCERQQFLVKVSLIQIASLQHWKNH